MKNKVMTREEILCVFLDWLEANEITPTSESYSDGIVAHFEVGTRRATVEIDKSKCVMVFNDCSVDDYCDSMQFYTTYWSINTVLNETMARLYCSCPICKREIG